MFWRFKSHDDMPTPRLLILVSLQNCLPILIHWPLQMQERKTFWISLIPQQISFPFLTSFKLLIFHLMPSHWSQIPSNLFFIGGYRVQCCPNSVENGIYTRGVIVDFSSWTRAWLEQGLITLLFAWNMYSVFPLFCSLPPSLSLSQHHHTVAFQISCSFFTQ